jgi:predicted metal-dependent HD superfamily phosphohydrolase
MLEQSWKRSWTGVGAAGDGEALMRELMSAYNSPHRHYHSLQHLRECLDLFERHATAADEPAEIEIALWFHDAVYDITATDNEAKSAELATTSLTAAGVNPDKIARIHEHILATRHSALPVGRDQQLLVDIDLAILGANRERFAEYERQVREEYSWVPSPIFQHTRAAILREFLARSPIYNTPALREELEARARDNLARSLEQLGG